MYADRQIVVRHDRGQPRLHHEEVDGNLASLVQHGALGHLANVALRP